MRNVPACLERHAQNAVLLLGFVAMLALYIPMLHAPMYCDDQFLYGNSVVRDGLNPLLFWLPGQESRNWPLFYTFAWTLYRFFAHNQFGYHCVALSLHALNGVLIFLIARDRSFRFPAAPSVLFWVHPIVAEPVTWVFQLLKLFALFLILLYVYFSPRKGNGRAGFVALFLSLASSSYSLLLAARAAVSQGIGRKTRVALLLLTAYFVLLSMASTAVQTNASQTDEVYRMILTGKPLSIVGGTNLGVDPGFGAGARFAESHYSLETPELRMAALGLSATLYLGRILAPLRRGFAQLPLVLEGVEVAAFALLGLLVLLLTFLAAWRGDLLFRALALTFLPASGLFYFSWLSYSLVADRLVYVPFAFFVLVAWRQLETLPKFAPQIIFVIAAGACWWATLERLDHLYRVYNLPFRVFFPEIP